MNKKTLLAGLALFLGLTNLSSSQTQSQSPNLVFEETAGLREFSGWMIARPMQVGALTERGMNMESSQAVHARGHEIMLGFEIQNFVDVTDEYIFAVPPGSNENAVSAELMASGAFQYVEPDWTLYPVGDPNDTFYNLQYHHQVDIMQSALGWDLHTGNSSVTIAFCDTGVLTTHNDLLLNRKEGYNAVDQLWESNGGDISPVASHGTNVTGCGAANGNNGLGVSGVGWNLSHRMMRVSNVSSGSAATSTLQHAARTAIEVGDRVASVSYSGPDSSSNLTTATYIKSIGGLLIWAAGNDRRNLRLNDRDADDLIVVGATDSNDNKANFSARGKMVDLVAPGVGVLTTDSSSNGTYAYVDGTSFSCPLTAGLVGLIWSADPTLTPDQVEAILKSSCDDVGNSGVDNVHGYGRINVFNAMTETLGGSGSSNPPTASFSGVPTSGTAPLDVSFSDTSSNAPTSWAWDFGDGASSTAQNPMHTYTSTGSYTVSLTVVNADGSDTDVQTNYVTVTTNGGGFTGQGFTLSKNADFSTNDSSYTRADTLYMLVWDDHLNVNSMRRDSWQLKAGNRKSNGNFTNNGDGSFTFTYDLSQLPSSSTSWNWSANLEDTSRVRYKPSSSIAVN